MITFPRKAEDRMHRFHQHPTIEGVRACWCKGRHPLLWTITKLQERLDGLRIQIHRRKYVINPIKILNIDPNRNDENLAPIEAYLYFQGSEEQLSKCKHLVINYPGGGFVTMNHLHHESYVQQWANYLRDIAFISVNYRKAPEHKYPAGVNDCYYIYKCIVATNGKCLGMNVDSKEDIKIALTGDSAGGNLAAVVCCRAIVENIKIPDGLLMAYPVLDLNMSLFRPVNDAVDFHRNYTNTIARYADLPNDIDKGDVLKSIKETPLRSYVDNEKIAGILSNAEKQLNEKEYKAFNRKFDTGIARNRGASMAPLTSRVEYLNDGVLPIKYLLVLGEAYIPTNGDPINDMYLSPIRAPLNVLSKFPTTRIHVGSVDPLVDDSRRFTSLLKYANQKIDVKLLEWDGVSHAYIQCPPPLLPQARFSCELAVQWLSKMLNVKVVNPESFKYDYDKREQDLYDATDDFAFLRSRM